MKNYKQTDRRWRNVPFAGSNIGRAGCGATAAANIIEHNPKIIANWLTRHHMTSNGHGTYWTGIAAVLDAYGFDARMLGKPSYYGDKSSKAENTFKERIQSRKWVGILLMGKSMFTSGGHYITIGDYKNGKYKVLDPYSKSRDGWHSWGDFDGKVKVFYTIAKKRKK